MKPIKLTLEAFGPYLKRTVIDFSELNNASLFLITGPTGGGKTSILDGMCFALYCRSTGGKRDFAGMRTSGADNDTPTLIEFEFLLGGKEYRFRRELRIHQNRNTKAYEYRDSHECSVRGKDGDWELIESRSETSVRQKAEELLHLTHKQFSQVIVLPQGDFLRLLRASSKEKGEILETLFSADIWEKITRNFTFKLKAINSETGKLKAGKDSLLENEGAESLEKLEDKAKILGEDEKTAIKVSREVSKNLEKSREDLTVIRNYQRLKAEKLRADEAQKAAKNTFEAAQAEMNSAQQKKLELDKLGEVKTQLTEQGTRLAEVKDRLQTALKNREEITLRKGQITAQEKKFAEISESAEKNNSSIKIGEEFVLAAQKSLENLTVLNTQKVDLDKKILLFSDLSEKEKILQIAMQKEKTANSKVQAEKIRAETLEKELKKQEDILRASNSVTLAHTLENGKPCPVCGSIHHPSPAFEGGDAMNPQELDILRNEERLAKDSLMLAKSVLEVERIEVKRCGEAVEQQRTVCEKLKVNFADLQAESKAICEQISKEDKNAKLLNSAKEKLSNYVKQKEIFSEESSAVKTQIAALKSGIEELEKSVAASEKSANGLSLQQAKDLHSEKQREYIAVSKQIEELTKQYNEAVKKYTMAGTALEGTQKAQAKANEDFANLKTPWKSESEMPSEQELSEKVLALEEENSLSLRKLGEIKNARKSCEGTLARVKEIEQELLAKEQEFGSVSRIAKALSGDNAKKMPILQYVLSMMFDETIESANRSFSTFSKGRYALRRIDSGGAGRGYSGLDLEVIDASSMLPRSIETLSGGEQFLASLSLAFGLSDIVQSYSGAVELESIFIDEGFGSLDGETLDTAMKALAEIQQSGRLVGIISHVSELRNRIFTKIEIERDSAGYAHAKIIS